MQSERSEDDSKSWTDDLPKCKNTGVGTCLKNSHWREAQKNKTFNDKLIDRSFDCKVDDNTYLYAIFTGHNGCKVAEQAMQRIAAEIIWGQLIDKKTDEEVRDVLRQTFIYLEKCYQESIDGLLAKKTVLQCLIAENSGNLQETLEKLKVIETELSIGASAALVLIHYSKLYICNVGTCRVLLCRNDDNKAPRVIQFSVDHNLYNEDEILRLRQLSVDFTKFKEAPFINTRAIGYYIGKGGYKECKYYLTASAEPIISQPEIVGGINIDESFQFLILLSSGTCKALEKIYAGDTAQENREIVKLCAKEFQNQTNLTDISQAVVNKLINDSIKSQGVGSLNREDITILIRNFHQQRINHVTFNSLVDEINNTIDIQSDREESSSSLTNIQHTDSTTTVSSENQTKTISDENQRIPAYVDFSVYYQNVEKARLNGTLPGGIEFD